MLLLTCPYCGPRAEIEFAFGRAAEAMPRPDASAEDVLATLYLRTNARGVSAELWQHVSGCRAWLVVERDTLTHDLLKIVPATAWERPT